ncbi:MAG: hypothetical protein ABIO94_13665, partial [Opitutaceae bacterium]
REFSRRGQTRDASANYDNIRLRLHRIHATMTLVSRASALGSTLVRAALVGFSRIREIIRSL